MGANSIVSRYCFFVMLYKFLKTYINQPTNNTGIMVSKSVDGRLKSLGINA